MRYRENSTYQSKKPEETPKEDKVEISGIKDFM